MTPEIINQTKPRKPGKPGFFWAFQHFNEIFVFRANNSAGVKEVFARIVGFYEDSLGGYFLVTLNNEQEFYKLPINKSFVYYIKDEKRAEIEPTIKKTNRFIYGFDIQEYKENQYELGREETR